jgi:glyoxylase-like metal-dependent hydrolase (beta-lactamase superfamily II)
MSEREGQATPHPPATPEFGFVTPGGAAHDYPAEGPMRVVKFSVGSYDNNVYLIASNDEGVIVDGAAEPERILSEVERLGARITAILQTHDHFDHTGALSPLVDALKVPILAHPADQMPVPTEQLADGERLAVGSIEIVALHTPGHTPGSTCYLAGAHLFSGDTLFPGGPGNTDGSRPAFRQIMRSLDRLFDLPDETRVSPGHGLDTTIGRERPYVEVWRARGW